MSTFAGNKQLELAHREKKKKIDGSSQLSTTINIWKTRAPTAKTKLDLQT